MKRPSFQFYPSDWQANSNLRRCTHAEKGAWIDVMCLLHDGDQYGQLRWTLKEIAQAIGAPLPLLRALVFKGVLKGDDKRVSEPFVYTPRSGRKVGNPVALVQQQDGPLWYSSRMVRDEYVRTQRGIGTRFGDDLDDSPNASPKPPFGEGLSEDQSAQSRSPKPPPIHREGDGPTSSSSSSISPSLRSGEGCADAPARPPPAGKPKRDGCALAAYLAGCKAAGVKPVPDGHAIRRWAADAGIGDEMLQVAWVTFRERYTEDAQYLGKRYRDWPGHFASAVKGNWFRLWFVGDGGQMCWSSTGLTHKAVLDARMAQREAGHEPA